MNLAFEPWIPVTTLDGRVGRASLADIFTKGESFADLVVRPHERIALMRLLICIGGAALDGPEMGREIDTAAERLRGFALVYLEKWKSSFDLFDLQRPFIQCVDLMKPAKVKKGDDAEPDTTSLSKLDFALATGNNTTLFDHIAISDEARIFSAPEVALALLTFQCFSPGGLIAQAFLARH